jgi:hypothetical protein
VVTHPGTVAHKGVLMDIKRIPVAGDPFYAAAQDQERSHPHACIEGFVFVGVLVEDEESGEEVEVSCAVPCKRCKDES